MSKRVRRRTVYPPIEPPPEEMFILRRPFARGLLVLLPSGDSYKLTADEARAYLKMLDDPFPDVAVDRVWNFYAIHYYVSPHESRVVPVGDVLEVMAPTEMESAGV